MMGMCFVRNYSGRIGKESIGIFRIVVLVIELTFRYELFTVSLRVPVQCLIIFER